MNNTTNFDTVISNYLNSPVSEAITNRGDRSRPNANVKIGSDGAPVIQTRGGAWRKMSPRELATSGDKINAAMQSQGMGNSAESSASPPADVTNINVQSPDTAPVFGGISNIFNRAGDDAAAAMQQADNIRKSQAPSNTPPATQPTATQPTAPAQPPANPSVYAYEPTTKGSDAVPTAPPVEAPAPAATAPPVEAPAPQVKGLDPGVARPPGVTPVPVQPAEPETPQVKGLDPKVARPPGVTPVPVQPAEPVGTGTVLKPPPGGFPKAPKPTNTAAQAAAAMGKQAGGTLTTPQPGVKGGGLGNLAMGAGLAGAGLYGLSKLIDRPSKEEREGRR